ncbi:UNVERIFIED_CONTAM: Slc5a5 [Trichonephila clavipes]
MHVYFPDLCINRLFPMFFVWSYGGILNRELLKRKLADWGGMKAVLWADVFQVVLMFDALFAIIIKGFMFLGSIGDIFDIANEGGRLVIPRFTLDPEAPYSMISVFAQGMILIMSSYGGSQNQVQRFRTLKNLNKSKL